MARKKPMEGKRYPLNMRTTKEMREKLERAARASGRSLVGEVEYRLERSFDRDEVVRLVADTVVKEIDRGLVQSLMAAAWAKQSKEIKK
jgi:hypothetical protein